MDDDLNRLGLVEDEDIMLDEAALILAQLDHASADLEPYLDLLDAMETRLDLCGQDAKAPTQRAMALAAVLGGEFGLAGDVLTYDDPANANLMSVLDRRRGLPVTLSLLWVAMARRLGWNAHVLNVPGHVLVMIGAEAVPIVVDPFRGGEGVSGARLAALAQVRAGEGGGATTFAVMPNRAVLIRLIQNQASRAEQAGERSRALDLYARMTIVAPTHAHGWWERSRLELAFGNVAGARASLRAVLEITRDPDLRRRVAQTLNALSAN